MFLECEGTITFIGGDDTLIDNYQCSQAWTINPDSPDFDPATDLDPQLIAGAVGVGFFILVPLWAAVIGVRYLLKLIK
jgi:hypothetical protein